MEGMVEHLIASIEEVEKEIEQDVFWALISVDSIINAESNLFHHNALDE